MRNPENSIYFLTFSQNSSASSDKSNQQLSCKCVLLKKKFLVILLALALLNLQPAEKKEYLQLFNLHEHNTHSIRFEPRAARIFGKM
jgi:hypothetical protein